MIYKNKLILESGEMRKILLMLFIMIAVPSFSYYNYYGAIAINQSTGASGYSYNYSDESSAINTALNHCGYNCIATVSFANTCASVAWSPSTGAYGWYSSRDRYLNNRLSKSYCGYSDCYVIADVCTRWY